MQRNVGKKSFGNAIRQPSDAWERAIRFAGTFGETAKPWVPVIYALALEAIELVLFGFAAVLTVQAIAPGIVPDGFDPATSLAIILFALSAVFLFGQRSDLPFSFIANRKNPFTWVGISWLAFLLTFSLIGSQFHTLPIVLFFYLVALLYMFRRQISRLAAVKNLARRFGRG